MKIVVQRVTEAEVEIENKINGKISHGLLILAGFTHDDTEEKVKWMCNKIAGLRIFSDEEGKMNKSVTDVEGSLLIVSNFTLYGEAAKGNRPNFTLAARPETAIPLYELMINELKAKDIKTETGIFGAMMNVRLTNDGPVTIVIER